MKSLGVKYVYTLELKPGSKDSGNTGYYGFHLPPKHIIPAAEEASVALMTIAKKIASSDA